MNYTVVHEQWFRFYSDLVPLKFGEKAFAHLIYEMYSGYLLINRKCGDINIK